VKNQAARNQIATGDVVIGTRSRAEAGAVARVPEPPGIYGDRAVLRAAWPWLRGHMRESDWAAAEAVDGLLADSDGDVIEDPRAATAPQSARVTIPDWVLNRHALVYGSSGYGKSYLSYVLITEQLKRGCSLVALDPKSETVRRLRGACHAASVPPERVAVIDATEPESAPGLNPFRSGGDPAEVVAQLMGLFEQSDGVTGSRMRQFLRNALTVAAWHALTLQDVPRLLWDDAFRGSVLRERPVHPIEGQYTSSRSFFTSRFETYREPEREASAMAVENKFDDLLGNRLFLRLFNAPKNTVDFASLFKSQGAVLACLGKGGGVTPAGRRTLGALLIHFLDAAAATRPGPVPVVLAVDEVGSQSRFMESSLQDIVNMARERGIRLLLATQHPGQLPESLRRDVMESSAFQAYFHLQDEGGEKAAKLLAAGDGDPAGPPSPRLRPAVRAAGRPEAVWEGELEVGRVGERYRGSLKAEIRPPSKPLWVDRQDPGTSLQRFCAYDPFAVPPPYLPDGRRASTTLKALFEAVPDAYASLTWEGGRGYVTVYLPPIEVDVPPPPVPPPKKPGKPYDRWLKTLQALRIGEAAVRIADRPAEVVTITQVAPPPDAPAWYVKQSRALTAAPPPPPVPEPPPQARQETAAVRPATNRTAAGRPASAPPKVVPPPADTGSPKTGTPRAAPPPATPARAKTPKREPPPSLPTSPEEADAYFIE
jgi:hypothetical protein